MPAIWRNDGAGWRLAAPVDFPLESDLHSLVQLAPQMLPLAGSPRLTIVGKEVLLGTGSADLIGIERDGRLCIIEVKLRRNAEARRAVIAQVLAYAGALHGLDVETLQNEVLGKHLRELGYETLQDAVRANDQEGGFDLETFDQGLSNSLSDGRFRAVIVLDSAPEELVQLVRYMEVITDKLLIDLISVSQYEIGDSKVIIPQRVEPERLSTETVGRPAKQTAGGYLEPGPEGFADSLTDLPDEARQIALRLVNWAKRLEQSGLVNLSTYHGSRGIKTLLPRLKDEGVGLVTIWKDTRSSYLQFWRKVFERRAPNALADVERLVPSRVGHGTTTRVVGEELMAALDLAYREAAGKRNEGQV